MTSTPEPVVVLTREQLYERVWDTPMRKLGPELGVTDVGLKKICGRFCVPTPGRGYWAKLQHGQTPKRPQLSKADDAGPGGIKFYPGASSRSPRPAEPMDSIAEREHDPANKIQVGDQLENPLPVVARTLTSLRAAKVDRDGLVRPRAQNTLDARVAPARTERAGRIMQALLVGLKERGLEVPVGGEAGGTRVRVLDEQVPFGLSEAVHRQERPPTPTEKREMEFWSDRADRTFHEYVPTGELSVAILYGSAKGRRRRFSDSRRRPVENLLNAFIVALYRVAEDIKAERVREEERRIERAAAERRCQEYRDERAVKLEAIYQEERQVAALLAEADRWHKSQSLRRYINAVRDAVVERDGVVPTGPDAETWLRWATAQADRLDPLATSPPSIIDEKSRWSREYL